MEIIETLKNAVFSGDLFGTSAYLKAGVIIFLIFLLIVVLASVRRHYIEWSFKGVSFGLLLGALLILFLEGFLILGGRTVIPQLLGWKDAPIPIQNAIEAGRSKLVDVLGVNEEIPLSSAVEAKSLDSVIRDFQSLTPSEVKKARSLICQP